MLACLSLSFLADIKKGLIQEFIDFSKIALLFSTTSSAVSHTLFIFALWCLYVQHWDKVYDQFNDGWNKFKESCWGITNSKSYKTKPLDPFNDTFENEDHINSISMDSIYAAKKKNSLKRKINVPALHCKVKGCVTSSHGLLLYAHCC